jgi:hypothetical protein
MGTTLVHRKYTKESLKYLNYYLSAYTKTYAYFRVVHVLAMPNLGCRYLTCHGMAGHAMDGHRFLGLPWHEHPRNALS